MGVILGILLFVFVVVCFLLIVVILLQSSKGEGLASSAFGGMGGGQLFGGRGAATFLSKMTTWLAVSYIVLSLLLARFYGEEHAANISKPADTETQAVTTQDASTDENVAVEMPAEEDSTASEAPASATAEETDSTATDSTPE